MTEHRMAVWRSFLAVTTLVLSVNCAHPRGQDEIMMSTWTNLRRLYASALAFRAEHGRMPESLPEICPEEAARTRPCMYSRLATPTDAWGHPIVLVPRGDEVMIRSGGQDGEPRTEDDLVLSSQQFTAQMQRYLGCYRVDFDWWEGFPGDRMILTDDTVSGDGYSYKAMPEVWDHHGYWWPDLDGSIDIVWYHGPTGLGFDLRILADSLVGTASSSSDVVFLFGTRSTSVRPLTAYRVSC